MIVQGGLVGALRRRMSLSSITLLAMFTATVGYALFGFVQATWQIYPIMFFYAFGFASVAAMLAPIVSSGALTYIASLARMRWQMGTPMFVCAAVEIIALTAAIVYFKNAQPVKAGHGS